MSIKRYCQEPESPEDAGAVAPATHPPTLYNTAEAAEYLRLSRSCLAKWRCGGGGPSFILAGRKVLYAKAVLDAWLDARVRTSTSDRGR